MTNIIDAFVVSIGLDPAPFKKGQREAQDSFRKTREDAAAAGKDVEAAAKRTADSIARIARELIGLFGVFVGSRAIVDFTSTLTKANAELGRFSDNLGMTPQSVAAWGAAAERIGGSASETSSTLARLSKQLVDLRTNGKLLPMEFSKLQADAGVKIDPWNGIQGYLRGTAEALEKLHKTDAPKARFYADAMGIDDHTYRLMIKHGKAIDSYVSGIEKSISPTDKAIENAQKLQESYKTFEQTVASAIDRTLSRLTPILVPIIEKMTAWIEANRAWIETGIVAAVQKLADWLASIDWAKVGQGLQNFASGAAEVAGGIDNVVKATEVLFGLWLGAKFAAVLFNARALATAGAASAAAGAASGAAGGAAAGAAGAAKGGGLLALLGRLAPLASLLLLSGDTAKRKTDKWNPTDRELDEVTEFKGWGRSGPQSRNHGRQRLRPEAVLHPSLMNDNLSGGGSSIVAKMVGGMDKATETTVDGRPVSKSNPMPVELAGQAREEKGFWGKLWDSVTGAMTGAGMGPMTSGSSLGGSGASRSTGSGDGASPVVPETDETYETEGYKGGGGTKGWWTPERQKHAYDKLRKGGLSEQGAKGLLSRWMNVEAAGGPASVNPKSGAFGIAQWLTKSRLDPIRGNTDFDAQIDYAIKELRSTESAAGDLLRRARTAEEGAVGASVYERAENYNPVTGRDNHTDKTQRGMSGLDWLTDGTKSTPKPDVARPAPASGDIPRKASFNDNIDPRLMDILTEAAKRNNSQIRFNSGYRPGDPRFHGRKKALDVGILDENGRELPNYQNAKHFRDYEKLAQEARRVQMKKYPELSKKFRWGGYFSGQIKSGRRRGKYGAVDTMHFDLGGDQLGMAGGSWKGGLTAEQRALIPGAESVGMQDQRSANPFAGSAVPPAAVASGASGAAAVTAANNDYRSYGGDQAMHIGDVNIHTAARDPEKIAAGITDAMRAKWKAAFATSATNYGLK